MFETKEYIIRDFLIQLFISFFLKLITLKIYSILHPQQILKSMPQNSQMIFLVIMTVFPIAATSSFNISECERLKTYIIEDDEKDLIECKEKGMHF